MFFYNYQSFTQIEFYISLIQEYNIFIVQFKIYNI